MKRQAGHYGQLALLIVLIAAPGCQSSRQRWAWMNPFSRSGSDSTMLADAENKLPSETAKTAPGETLGGSNSSLASAPPFNPGAGLPAIPPSVSPPAAPAGVATSSLATKTPSPAAAMAQTKPATAPKGGSPYDPNGYAPAVASTATAVAAAAPQAADRYAATTASPFPATPTAQSAANIGSSAAAVAQSVDRYASAPLPQLASAAPQFGSAAATAVATPAASQGAGMFAGTPSAVARAATQSTTQAQATAQNAQSTVQSAAQSFDGYATATADRYATAPASAVTGLMQQANGNADRAIAEATTSVAAATAPSAKQTVSVPKNGYRPGGTSTYSPAVNVADRQAAPQYPSTGTATPTAPTSYR